MVQKVIVAGATGLIGSSLLQHLIQHPKIKEILLLVRRELPIAEPKVKQLLVNFDQLEEYTSAITGDAVFCCLGSTKKKTPDMREYRKVDFLYPLKLAKESAINHVSQFHIVTALGANKKSLNFYSKLKGEVEEAIKQVPLHSIHIYQPSLLLGQRNEQRAGEKAFQRLMTFLNPLLIGPLKEYRGIRAEVVAKAMINQLFKNTKGIHVYTSNTIKELA